MKKLFLMVSVLFISSTAQAAPLKILFFYPGGQGNQEQAQPLLDSFAEGLKKASGGKIEAQIFYIPDQAAGLNFIKTQKPQSAILGLETFDKYGRELGAVVIAKTLQLPSGDGTDQYFLLGKSGTALPSSGTIQAFSPRPVDSSFVSTKLFPDKTSLKFEIQITANPVGEMRAIGEGTRSGYVLLDQFEYTNVSRLKTPWAKNLAVLAQSAKISSAPLVIFPQNIAPDLAQELQSAVLSLGKDPTQQATLADLRLKGFKKASSVD